MSENINEQFLNVFFHEGIGWLNSYARQSEYFFYDSLVDMNFCISKENYVNIIACTRDVFKSLGLDFDNYNNLFSISSILSEKQLNQLKSKLLDYLNKGVMFQKLDLLIYKIVKFVEKDLRAFYFNYNMFEFDVIVDEYIVEIVDKKNIGELNSVSLLLQHSNEINEDFRVSLLRRTINYLSQEPEHNRNMIARANIFLNQYLRKPPLESNIFEQQK